MHTLVLLRHGESTWNRENRFTGWTDVELSEAGRAEAVRAGETLKREGLVFDRAYTSVLKRAIQTLHLVLETLDLAWIPEEKSYRLNERHYGALQGLDKAETAARYGEAQVKIWRRSYDEPPPPLDDDDRRRPGLDPRYRGLGPTELPRSESLKDTVARVLPYWTEVIAPSVRRCERVIISAHGNSLRALCKHLDGISEEEIVGLNLPTGVPLVYELDERLTPLGHRYLGDPDEIARRIDAVAAQGKART